MKGNIEILNDPYISAWVRDDVYNIHNLKGWQAEAYRRWISGNVGQDNPQIKYYNDEPTWYWSETMIEELINILNNNKDIRLCSWDTEGPGSGFHFFNRVNSENHAIGLINNENYSITNDYIDLLNTKSPTELVRVVRLSHFGDFVALGEIVNEDRGIRIETMHYYDNPKNDIDDISKRMLLLIQALLKTEVVQVTKIKADRAMRRRAKRKGVILEHTVNMVIWRKEYKDSFITNETRKIGNDKHWSVRGHVRNQWFPSKKCHYAKFIPMHYKGNLAAPLHKSVPVVNHVVR